MSNGKCKTCMGFGMWFDGSGQPMAIACPSCGANANPKENFKKKENFEKKEKQRLARYEEAKAQKTKEDEEFKKSDLYELLT